MPKPTQNSSGSRTPKQRGLGWPETIQFLIWLSASAAAGFTLYLAVIANDTEQRQMRAYVFLRDIRLEKRNDDAFDIIPEWENTGNSETVNMRAHLNRHLSDVELPQWFSFGDLPITSEVPILLGPRSITNINFNSIPRNCLLQFNRRDELKKFYIWGWTRYNDTLTNATHITRFCWDINQVVFSTDDRVARLSHNLCN
jgi:hypothetical protein